VSARPARWRALIGWRHSLSTVLGVLGLLCVLASYLVEHHTWRYDFWMSIGCDLLGAAVLVLGARYLWEQRSDPAAPPTEK
jgi:drug/metabolite transporter (DMT)-like permease